jgi:sec-independent protein translocase protein TatA
MGRIFEPGHLIPLVLVLVILFGAKRLPDAARGLGRSLRIFKSEISQMKDDDKPADSDPERGPSARGNPAPKVGPLEGRVVDGNVTRTAPVEHRDA